MMTDNEIIKANSLLRKLEEAYNAYFDTSKGMPYDIDTTLRETAICLENSLNEINRQKAEIERLLTENHSLAMVQEGFKDMYKIAKTEAYKEFAESLDKEFSSVVRCNYGYIRNKILRLLKEKVGDDK